MLGILCDDTTAIMLEEFIIEGLEKLLSFIEKIRKH